jgi:hypothetical protein
MKGLFLSSSGNLGRDNVEPMWRPRERRSGRVNATPVRDGWARARPGMLQGEKGTRVLGYPGAPACAGCWSADASRWL